MFKLRLSGNTKRNFQFILPKYWNGYKKNIKHWKNSIPVFTEPPCDGSDNYEVEGDEKVGINKDVGLDNVNAGDG